MQNNTVQQHIPYTGMRLFLATASLGLATFMQVLDTTIANVSIPAISGDLGVSTTQGTWVITSFAVSNAVAVPLTGWLTRRIGQMKLFLGALLLFVISSFLCGISWNIEMLIGFRIMQGFVAGPMIPLSMSLLLQCFPRERAGMALALWSMTVTVAPIAGPILGGWLTDNVSWPWIFYINIPIGIASAALTWAVMREKETQAVKLPVDKVGLILLALWVGCFQIMLDKGKELDWFSSPAIITLLVISIIAFTYFMIWELTEKHPIIDLSLFKNRNFSSATLTLSLGYGVFFTNIVLTPLWLQTNMGYTATWAGLVTAPFGLFAIILSPVIGRNMNRVDPRLFVTGAFIFFAYAFYMRSGFSTSVDARTVALNHLIQGIGMAAFMAPLNAIAVSGLTPDRIASASGLMNFARIMLGAFGASIGTTVWENRAAMHHSNIAERITPYTDAVKIPLHRLSEAGINTDTAVGIINSEVTRQSFMLSVAEIYKISAFLFIVLIGVVWFARPKKMQAKAPAAGH